ncbi:MAG: diguanylate cyclase [Hyphomicrobiaceae bacterium]
MPAGAFVLGLGIARFWPGARWEGHTRQSSDIDSFQLLDTLASVVSRNADIIFGIILVLLGAMIAYAVGNLHRLSGGSGNGSGTQAQAHDATNVALGLEIASILKFVRDYIDTNNRYADSLHRAQATLGSIAKPDQVWGIVKLLIAENEKIRTDARDLKTRLEASQTHIDQLKENLIQAEQVAFLDPLTNVGNRRRLESDLARMVVAAHANESPLCLVLADLDNFKRINEKFGRPVGDEVLKLFSSALMQNVKGRDAVARFGGEEFAVILPDTTMGNAYHLAERILGDIKRADWLRDLTGHPSMPMTASFGIAQLREEDSAEELLKRADAKLLEAKRNGRNQVVIERSVAA